MFERGLFLGLILLVSGLCAPILVLGCDVLSFHLLFSFRLGLRAVFANRF